MTDVTSDLTNDPTDAPPRKILLDCDPGHDDAIALILAAGDPRLDLLAVTTVAGNQTLDKVTRNALAVCAIAGIDVPVAAGADRPLVRPMSIAPDIHGESGLDGPVLPPPVRDADERHAVELIVDTVLAHEPGTVTLVPTGPLTNIALAARLEPRIVERVREVVLMGGSATRGNRTPAAEFNILADPEAAQAVFDAGWDVTMVGLDVTHQATADAAVVERIGALGSPLGAFVVDVLQFFGETYRRHQGFDAPPVHDPVCVAHLLDPAVLATRSAFVAVELAGTWTTGMTVVDYGDAYGRPHNAHVGTRLDRDRFWDLVVAAIERLGSTSAGRERS